MRRREFIGTIAAAGAGTGLARSSRTAQEGRSYIMMDWMGDRELVSRISNQFLSPLPSSQIR